MPAGNHHREGGNTINTTYQNRTDTREPIILCRYCASLSGMFSHPTLLRIIEAATPNPCQYCDSEPECIELALRGAS